MDTPGIMQPKITDNNVGLKLSVCGNIKDKIVGKNLICQYLLYLLNRYDYLEYIKIFKTKNKIEKIDELVELISNEFNIIDKNNALDFILKYFHQGKLGKVTFDEDIDRSIINKQ